MDPVRTDGRDIDRSIAVLSGEGSEQRAEPWHEVPRLETDGTTYYGRPLLKESVWTADIPLYFFAGGAAGAALALGAAVQLGARGARARRELRKLSATCHWIGITGSTAGAALLIHDLGRPTRFLNMMRVFRPTSPMNMGTWILAGAAPTAITTGLFINRGGLLGRIGETAGYASGVFGVGLACYTGVLVANSAIPAWQESRRWLPVAFAGSAVSAAAGVLELFYEGGRAERITQKFGAIGRATEVAAAKLMERSASNVPRVGLPFRSGVSGALWKSAGVLTMASLVLSLIPGRSRTIRRLAGGLALGGSLCLRFAVQEIGQASARDARASFEMQRAVTP